MGLYIDDLNFYDEKNETTFAELSHADVIPDKINSCLRQQIKGYVSDLNSVVGVMPKDKNDEVVLIKIFCSKS